MRKTSKKSELILEAIHKAYFEEKEDFLEDNAELSDFQNGVLFGLKLAEIKIKNVLDK